MGIKSSRKYLSFFIPKWAQGIVHPLAVLSVLPAVTHVFFFKAGGMPCELGVFARLRARFLFPLREIETEPMMVIYISFRKVNHKSFRFANHFHSEESIILNFPVKVGQYHVLQHNAYLPFDRCPEGLRLRHALSA